jgi:uncharacterized membrane protein
MSLKTYRLLRIFTSIFVAMTVSSAVVSNNFNLAIFAVAAGMIFLFVIKRKTKGVLVDERLQTVGEKAARASYVITTITMAISSFILVFMGRTGAPYLTPLATILSYLTLFSMFIYSVAFSYFNHKYGSDNEE